MNARECSAVLAAVKGRLRRNPGGFKPLTASARGEIGWLDGAARVWIDPPISPFMWARQAFTLSEMNN
jgi:hypothetical protein